MLLERKKNKSNTYRGYNKTYAEWCLCENFVTHIMEINENNSFNLNV